MTRDFPESPKRISTSLGIVLVSAPTIHSGPLTQPVISAPEFIENSDPNFMAWITYGLYISHFKFPPEHTCTLWYANTDIMRIEDHEGEGRKARMQ